MSNSTDRKAEAAHADYVARKATGRPIEVTPMKAEIQPPPPGYADEGRLGGWIQTFTGRPFWPCDPRPEDIDARDIAHALAHQCRFAGHTAFFYSVAEHCVRASLIVPHEHALWALLHDAPEAYLVDLPRPIKHMSGVAEAYQAAEARLMGVVCEVFGLDPHQPSEVTRADMVLLQTEARDLMTGSNLVGRDAFSGAGVKPLEETLHPVPPAYAEGAYLSRLADLTGTQHLLDGGPIS